MGDTSTNVNISERPCIESVNHERGRGDRQTKQRWHMVDLEPTFYYIRWTGETATRREHMVGMIRELEAGGGGVDDNSAYYRKRNRLTWIARCKGMTHEWGLNPHC